MLTFGSLFAGIGGFDLGFERAGMKCLWQVEIDPFCQRVLAKHWPDVERFEDVRECGARNLQPVDVICGGFPCQPHSVAGKQRGKEDDRNLWPEYRRVITELRPHWVTGENVPGIRTTILDSVLSDLEGLDYSAATFIIPACSVNAPHRRNRIFIIANTESAGKINVLESSRGNRAQTQHRRFSSNTRWTHAREWGNEPSPRMVRVANGIPNRVDRLRSLGNAVVPQVAEWIGRQIIECNHL